MLPGIDGFSVCRRLRESVDIPILMVTARQEDIDKIRGLGLGADDYIENSLFGKVFPLLISQNLVNTYTFSYFSCNLSNCILDFAY